MTEDDLRPLTRKEWAIIAGLGLLFVYNICFDPLGLAYGPVHDQLMVALGAFLQSPLGRLLHDIQSIVDPQP